MPERNSTKWHTGLWDCFEDASSCCYGFWCCPCLACTVADRFEECSCLPLCDIISPAILTFFGIPLWIPPAALSLRAAMRNRYGIKGSLTDDIAVSCFCEWCSYCQMHRELKHRRKKPVVVNVQNNTTVNMQAPPVMMMPSPQPVVMMPSPQPVVMMPAPQPPYVKQQRVVLTTV